MNTNRTDRENRSFWQRTARVYGAAMKSSGRLYQAVEDSARPYLGKKMNVLELACGSGQLSFPLARLVRLWEATDFSEAMITEAKKKEGPKNLHFSVQDATRLPYGPETFDVVVISNALHIMPYPDQALAEIRRVLKPGGILLAPTFLHGRGAGFRLRVHLMELAGFRTFHEWNEQEFVEFLKANGFWIREHSVLGGSLAPLCFAAAGKSPARASYPGGSVS